MGEEELLGGLADLGTGGVTVAAAGGDGAALEGRGGSVKDEDGLGAEEEELADAAEEAEKMGIAHHLALFVPHRLHELHHPYARICQAQNNPRGNTLQNSEDKVRWLRKRQFPKLNKIN